jgi:hypothetical protein
MPEPVQHLPDILSLTLSPDTAVYMDGDGSVVVTVEITFSDSGEDINALWARMPDGSIIEFDGPIDMEAGTFAEAFAMPTNQIGAFLIEFWLVDRAGDSSAHRVTDFSVVDDGRLNNWTSRLSGLPYTLNDVIWDGDVFVAVGESGSILTSVNGIDWVERQTASDAGLSAVASYGPDIIAVGDGIVLLSTDHGENWITKNSPIGVVSITVAMNSSKVVVTGRTSDTWQPSIMISEDRGESWQIVDTVLADSIFFADLIYRGELFIATASSFFIKDGGRVLVSSDGKVWNEVVRDEQDGLHTVIQGGGQFIVAGTGGTVYTSMDGFNWTERQTPEENADYYSAAWDGSKLVLAGGATWSYWFHGGGSPSNIPVGIYSTDGGLSWDAFNIDGDFLSVGMAFGNERFVSVGVLMPVSGEGAIYTSP